MGVQTEPILGAEKKKRIMEGLGVGEQHQNHTRLFENLAFEASLSLD